MCCLGSTHDLRENLLVYFMFYTLIRQNIINLKSTEKAVVIFMYEYRRKIKQI
uniref:Uncharacterized protein n=1 Tax=uncultured Alphaproteobacteria bacterium TaxID=91750 RepID=A0A6G8F226_9PROT|nr:hypothetical protein PlAlph_0940 [uncultured Alphaproteobacteria bacterium]